MDRLQDFIQLLVLVIDVVHTVIEYSLVFSLSLSSAFFRSAYFLVGQTGNFTRIYKIDRLLLIENVPTLDFD